MFEDLASRFHNQPLSKYLEYIKLRKSGESGNDRLVVTAVECASVLFHFREHMPRANRKTRAQVSKECFDYKFVADVANAGKHGELEKVPTDGPLMLRSEADISELLTITYFEDACGSYSDDEAVVMVNCLDGQDRCLDDALLTVLNYWGRELARLNIVDFTELPAQSFPGTTYVAREDAKTFSFTATQGLPFRARFQMLRYDNALGYAKPIDLTGVGIEAKLYRSTYALELSGTFGQLGDKISICLELNEKEHQRYFESTSERERDAFLEQLVLDHKEEVERRFSNALKGRSCS